MPRHRAEVPRSAAWGALILMGIVGLSALAVGLALYLILG